MNSTDILLWAAGSRRPLIGFPGLRDERILDFLGIDSEEVLRLLKMHRLLQTFLWRSGVEKPAWATHYLRTRASQMQMEAHRRLQHQMRVASELSRLAPTDAPAVFLKGFSFYALTADPSTLRETNDIDVCHGDPEVFWQQMQATGFVGKRHYTYEYAKARKDGVTVDLHERFPVLSYPEGLEAASIFPSAPLGSAQCGPKEVEETAFVYEVLLNASVLGRTPETSNLNVLDPTMSALLLCAHTFRNFVTRPHYLLDECLVKLGEIREIAQSSMDPAFVPSSFRDFAVAHQLKDSVAFVNDLLNTYQIPHSLPILSSDVEYHPRIYPENMVWGGWVTDGKPTDWVLQRSVPNFLSSVFSCDGKTRPLCVGSSSLKSLSAYINRVGDRVRFGVTFDKGLDTEILLLFGGDYQITFFVSGVNFNHACKDAFVSCLLRTSLEDEESNLTVICTVDTSHFPRNIKHDECLLALRRGTGITYVTLPYSENCSIVDLSCA